jgi:hypothetical protein
MIRRHAHGGAGNPARWLRRRVSRPNRSTAF